MNKWMRGVLLAGGVLLCAAPVLAAGTMKPGLWEITTTMEMRGMDFQPPPQTVRHCYTEQEVRDEPVPMDDTCKLIDMKTSGNRMSWKMVCTGEAASEGEGEMTFRGDSAYEGTSRMTTQGMMMKMKYQGRRLGECR